MTSLLGKWRVAGGKAGSNNADEAAPACQQCLSRPDDDCRHAGSSLRSCVPGSELYRITARCQGTLGATGPPALDSRLHYYYRGLATELNWSCDVWNDHVTRINYVYDISRDIGLCPQRIRFIQDRHDMLVAPPSCLRLNLYIGRSTDSAIIRGRAFGWFAQGPEAGTSRPTPISIAKANNTPHIFIEA